MKAETQKEYKKKWTGVCEVITGERVAKLTSLKTDKEGKPVLFPDKELSIKIDLSKFPKYAQSRLVRPNMKDARKFRIRLNEDGDEVDGVTPVNGTYTAKANGIVKKNDGSYFLDHKVYNEDTKDENSHDEFIVTYEFTDKKNPFYGAVLPGFYLHYKFAEIPEGQDNAGFTKYNTVDTPNAKQLHKLQDWAEVHGGILDDDIRWPDDGIILDTVEDRLLKEDREVQLVFVNGNIAMVQPVEDYNDNEVTIEEIDEKFPDIEETPKAVEVPAKSKKATRKSKTVAADDDDL